MMNINNLEALIFDFDGVLTDNLVYVNQNGDEIVSCSRSDGLAFDVLHKMGMPVYILSTEKNSVVSVRANKLKAIVIQGVSNKSNALIKLAKDNSYKLENLLYVGNDLNDYNVMKLCGYSACPADSHESIIKISDIILATNGGKGVVRELLEDFFSIDFLKFLN